jgi:hypothetical protein
VNKGKAVLHTIIAALLILGAAICAGAQQPKSNGAVKQNTRELDRTKESKATPVSSASAEDVIYSYEFEKSDFLIRRIVIKHDAEGHGEISFERQGDIEPIVEPVNLSESVRARILALWRNLRFMDSTVNYQADRQFPQLGTMRLRMTRGTQTRVAEFNWTHDADAKALADEYRRAGNQAIFIFDISVARQNQPLDSPKLLDRLDSYLKRGELSDPQQLIPLLREINTDERFPLMARNHAARILKKLEKE